MSPSWILTQRAYLHHYCILLATTDPRASADCGMEKQTPPVLVEGTVVAGQGT